jgi:hypothetical protein
MEHRIADRRVIRLIQKWLKAGVLEEGKLIDMVEGTPQGGSASPLLANVYLHYVFDLWVQAWRKKRHVLIILSDMRHHTPNLDLESGGIAPHFSALKTQNGFSCVALPDVEVFVAGVGADGKSIAYWESLKEFWSEYFQSAGARLRAYSALRELSAIPQETVAH